MSNKVKLAFAMLESEIELMYSGETESTRGGDGVIRSGSGTSFDPYVISTTIINNSSSAGVQSGIQAMNGGSAYVVDGKYYKLEVVAGAGAPSRQSGKDSNGFTYDFSDTTISSVDGYGSDITTVGLADKNSISIFNGKLDTYNYTSTGTDNSGALSRDQVTKLATMHEIAHTLGLSDSMDVPIMNGLTVKEDASGKKSVIGGPGELNNQAIQYMLESGRVHFLVGSGGSTGSITPPMGEVVSTGVDDIGFFQIREFYDSSGNAHSSIYHPYGNENAISESYYENLTGLISSGYDDWGLYYNYAYNSDSNIASTGYYHPDFHTQSTGASTGDSTTGL